MLQTKSKIVNKIRIRWGGARTQFRRRNSKWDGVITIENGEILEVIPIGFDLPWEGIISKSATAVHFKSTTAGDYDIIDLTFTGEYKTIINFSSDILMYDFHPFEITEAVTHEAGLTEQRLEIIPIYKEEYPDKVEFTHKIEGSTAIQGAYYLRVLQTDGEKAWSSPIFVK